METFLVQEASDPICSWRSMQLGCCKGIFNFSFGWSSNQQFVIAGRSATRRSATRRSATRCSATMAFSYQDVQLPRTFSYHDLQLPQTKLSVFSLLYASTQRRKPEPRGMARQYLRTFERVPVNKELLTRSVLVNTKLLTGTVPVSNLFHLFLTHFLN